MRLKRSIFFGICIVASSTLLAQQKPLPGEQPVWTLTEYPDHVRQLTHFGERADWSHDGKKILFVGRTFGDVYEVEVETGIITPVTHHYYHGGYTRALYLANGDILLSGPHQFNPEAEFESRRWRCELWVLDKSFKTPPQKLGTYCFEGPCVSRTKMKIAWTQNYGQEQVPVGRFVIWEADIDYSSGKPQLDNQHLVIDNSHQGIEGAVLEVQNYRPPEEEEIIFQSTIGVETFGYHTETGELTNYSLALETHEEPEGIYPDGKHTLVESDRLASKGTWATNVDFYKMALDGSGKTERLSYFAESGEYRGTNPVVSDDGRYIAFQVSPSTAEAGIGIGIFVYDIEAAKEYNRTLKKNR